MNRPKVGIYWIRNDKIVAFADDMNDVEVRDGFRDSDKGHIDYWERLGLPGEYFDLPRGRVIYNVKEDLFMVYMPSLLSKNEEVLSQIVEMFNLPRQKISIRFDTHYELELDPFADDDYWD